MSDIYHGLGVWTGIVAACALLAIVQSLLLVAIGYLGKRIYKRLTRTYALHVVWYWLERMEKEGKRCFEKADDTSGNL